MINTTVMKSGNQRLSSYGTTIFEVMSGLARELGAINLGQGFPDEDGPLAIRHRAADCLIAGPNQYPPMRGLLELRRAMCEHDKRFYGLDYDADREALVTSGATEALAAAFLGLCETGDEVVVFEPTYDTYRPMAERAGATVRSVRLSPPDWSFDPAELRSAFSERTKFVLLNSPTNPTGKVFSVVELDLIATECKRVDAFAVCDEVYEHIVFAGAQHVPLATRPGMRERTVRIGSAGKSFSLTGWKVGLVTGAEVVVSAMVKAHQFLTFTTPPGLQLAVADGLLQPDAYWAGLAGDLQEKRDLLEGGLRDLGFGVASCQGTYFIVADFSPLRLSGTDFEVCQELVREAGVATIPFSAFYTEAGGPSSWLRFAFCKNKAVLEEGLARLRKFFGK